jgi:sugar/nucleoside kinase (ribokinase family)
VSAVELDPRLPTGIAIIYVSDEGENSIGISAEANGALTPAVVQGHEAMIAAAHTLLLQLEVPLESVQEAARLARAHGTRVVLNPAPARPLKRSAGAGGPHHPQPDRSRAADRRQGDGRSERPGGGHPLPPDGHR